MEFTQNRAWRIASALGILTFIIYIYIAASCKAGRPMRAVAVTHCAVYSKPPRLSAEKELCAFLLNK